MPCQLSARPVLLDGSNAARQTFFSSLLILTQHYTDPVRTGFASMSLLLNPKVHAVTDSLEKTEKERDSLLATVTRLPCQSEHLTTENPRNNFLFFF